MKNLWKNVERFGLLFSILASGVALYISSRSCIDSNEALEMSKKEFQARRSIILQSELGNMSPGFEFKTFDQNQKLQKLVIHLPISFQNKELQIDPPEFYFSLNDLQDSLLHILKLNITNYKTDAHFNIPSILVPAIIVANYVVAGDVMSDKSLYNIEFIFRQAYFNNSSEIQLDFKNLIFISRWSDEKEHYQSLNEYWAENFKRSLKTLGSN